MGTTLKDRLDTFFGRDKDVDVQPDANAPYEQYARNLLDRVARNEELSTRDLLLLPGDHAKDLTNRYLSGIDNDPDNYKTPAILKSEMDKTRARRRIVKRLSNEQQTVDRRESVNELAGVFVQLKEDEKNREDVGLTEVEAARRRRIRSEDLAENKSKLISEFQERGRDITNEVDKFIENGSMDYEDAYLYFAGKDNHVQQLDIKDFFLRDHPSRYFSDVIPFYGSAKGLSRMAQLSDKIEALDRASPQDLIKPEYVNDLRDVALFLDSIDADKSVGYKFAEALTMMGDYIITRGAGRVVQGNAMNALKSVFPRMNRAMTLATSPNFRKKILNAANKARQAVQSEATLAVNPAGRGLATWNTYEQHRVRSQELIGVEVADGPEGQKYVKYLNFKDPKATVDAVTSAVGSQVVEGLSERLGGAFDLFRVSKDKQGILGQVFNGALFKSFKKRNPDVESETILKFLENANINGIIPEIMEERAADMLIGGLGIDQPGMEIRPGFQLFNQNTGEWEREFRDLVIPSAEDFAIEVATIGTVGALARKFQSSRTNPLPPIELKDETPLVKGDDDFVRQFVEAGQTSTGQPRAVKVNDTLLAITNRRLEKLGLKPIKYNRKGKISPQYIKKVKERGIESLLPELVEFYSNPSNAELFSYASTWYGDRFDQTINLLSEQFPELNNQDERSFFTFLVGITSPSQAPEPNLMNAINEFMIDKGFPTDTKTSEAVSNQIATFKTIAKHKGGHTAALDFLSRRMTGKELKKELFEMGLYKNTIKAGKKPGEVVGPLPSGITAEETVYGMEIFGPKVGAFTLNLAGVEDIPTIDLWMLRNIASHLGQPFDNKSLAQANYQLKRAKDKGPTKTDWADNLVRTDFRDNGNRKRIKLYREVVTSVQQEFNKETGENFSAADIQALIWYMEKSIFTSMGTTGSTVSMADYLSVAENLVNSGGVFNENTLRRIRDPKRLEQERKAEEILSRDDKAVGEETVQEEDGTSPQEADSQEPDGGRPSGSVDTEDTQETPKKRPGFFTKEVPQVAELDPSQAQTFYNNLEEHKANDDEGYSVELKDLEQYQKPYVDFDGTTQVTPTLVMSEDGKSGAALLFKEFEDGTTSVDIASVFSGENTEVSGQEVMRSAIRKAQRMGADKITLDAFEGKLPGYYELFGFVETGRDTWNDEFAPPDWQYEYHKKEYPDTNGRPDVVYMEFDPKKAREEADHPMRFNLGLEGELDYYDGGLLGSVTRYLNDNLDPLRKLSEQFEGQKGRLRVNEDFYSQARRSYNIAIAKFNSSLEWADDFIARMAKSGISIEMLDRYMHAKHARERNALVAARNPDIEAGAGYNNKSELMTDEKADEILDEFKDTVIDDYAKEFRRNVILRNIQVRLQGGLLTEEQARIYSGDAPIKTFEDPKDNVSFINYVPLNLELEDDGRVGGIFKNVDGTKGHSLNGPESQRVRGTDAQVQRKSIFEMGMQNLLMGMTRAEANQTNLKLLNVLRATDVFVNKNGSKVALFEFEQVDRGDRKYYDKFGNPKYIYASELADNQMLMKEDGIEYIVTINNDNLARSFKQHSVFGQNPIVLFANSVNNFIKQTATSWSPEFFIGNVQSDLQTGLTNLGIENSVKIAAQAALNIPKAANAIRQYNFNDPKDRPDTDTIAFYKEMIAYGGKISFFDFKGFEDKYKDIGKRMEKMGDKAQAKSNLKIALEYIQSVNEVFEGQMRLATYIAMRQNGYPAEKSAIAARDVTIDFNKRGELASIMESMYMFSKVGVNNIYRMGQVMKSNPKKAAAMSSAFMFAGYYLAEMSRSHDEEEWEKKSEWERDHYFQIPNNIFTNVEGEKRGHIPFRMAYGWGMFAGLGVMISDYNYERKKLLPDEEMADGHYWSRAYDIMFSNFAPASGMPTLPLSMASDLIRNKDALGRTIKPYKYDPIISDFELEFGKTPADLRDLSYIIANAPLPGNPGLTPNGNRDPLGRISYMDGGTLDISPAELDYFFGRAFTGVYTFMNNTIGLGDKVTNYNRILNKTYDGLNPSKTPFIRRFWSYKPTKDLRQSRYQRAVRESRRRMLNSYEVTAAEESIRGLYSDGVIGLNEYNKIFDQILDNQARLLATPKSLRKLLKERATVDVGRLPTVRGARRTNRPKVKKTRVGLEDALGELKGEMERRTADTTP